jgi:hypothetical protein
MARKQSKPKGPTPVESIRHKDSRINIPTEELRDFVAEDEQAPKKMLYPRDPSLEIAVKVINHYGDEVLKVYDVVANAV